MSRPLLFIAAEPRECLPFVGRWDSARRASLPVHWAREGMWRGREVMAIANGAGWARAKAAVEASPLPSAICNIGFCGALDEKLAPGDVFVADTVIGNGGRWVAERPVSPAVEFGTLVSAERIAQTAAEKRELRRGGARVVEMEAAAVAAASDRLSVPFYCVRAVSDLAGEDFANDFNRCLRPDGRFDVVKLVMGALGSPVRRFGELIRLSRRTTLASNHLGEFLGNCSFR
jgi:adenosylhomocysteine nucleosidase